MYRPRWKRQPDKKELILQERDYALFELLNRHGPLPSHYLYQLTRHLKEGKELTSFLERVRTLYHGAGDTFYLSRPTWQGDNPARKIIYELAPAAISVLKERDIPIIHRHGGHANDGPIHDFMGACCMASLQVFIEAQRHEYRDLTAILRHKNCPPDADPLSIPVDDKALEPDAFFAVKPDFYAVEWDRNKETIQDTPAAHTSYGRKLKKYIRAFETEAFEKHYGIHRPPKVITITTNRAHMRNMQRYARSIKAPDRFIFSCVEGFGPNWRIPKDLLYFNFEDIGGNPVSLV